jgi:hypothetical protein
MQLQNLCRYLVKKHHLNSQYCNQDAPTSCEVHIGCNGAWWFATSKQIRHRDQVLQSRRLSLSHRTTQLRLRSSFPQAQGHAVVGSRRRPSVCATRSTASSSPRSPASFAAVPPPKRITFALPNNARSAARSATNIRSRSAGSITAICTTMATRPRGGPGSTSTRCPSPSSYGNDDRIPSCKGRLTRIGATMTALSE